MPFQTAVNSTFAPAVEGDFASANSRTSALTIEGGFVAGALGVQVGRFAWKQADGRIVNTFASGAGNPTGFVHRDMGAALITGYLDESGNAIRKGFMVTLHNEGDFWVTVRGAASYDGAPVYANTADGTAVIGAAPAGATATGSVGATFTGTATSGSNQLTTTAVTGVISVGDTLTGTGIPAGTTILNQVSGTAGGAGVYTMSAVSTGAVSGTVTSYGTTLNVTAVASGILRVGMPISGTGIPANASIASQSTGATGGTGMYTLNTPATAYAASTTLTTVGGVLTNFVARTANAIGELCKISTWGKA